MTSLKINQLRKYSETYWTLYCLAGVTLKVTSGRNSKEQRRQILYDDFYVFINVKNIRISTLVFVDKTGQLWSHFCSLSKMF